MLVEFLLIMWFLQTDKLSAAVFVWASHREKLSKNSPTCRMNKYSKQSYRLQGAPAQTAGHPATNSVRDCSLTVLECILAKITCRCIYDRRSLFFCSAPTAFSDFGSVGQFRNWQCAVPEYPCSSYRRDWNFLGVGVRYFGRPNYRIQGHF